MRRLGFLTAIAAVTLAVIAGGLWVYLKQQFEAPGPLDREAVVIVPRGAGLSAIADALAAAGVISNPTAFALGVRLFADARALQAGEYAFAADSSMREAAAVIASGRTVVNRLTVTAGLTSTEDRQSTRLNS